MELYKLQPVYADYLWGGTKLIGQWNKQPPSTTLAESWELSMHEKGRCRVASGTHAGEYLSDIITREDYGINGAGFDRFPVMIKLIDAAKDLSIQVHPSDEYALAHEGEPGKTEMWYILEAREDAGIYCGLKQAVSPKELGRRIDDSTLTDILRFVPVKAGDCCLIPAGTIHAICAGVVLIEIQQNSNINYRLFDYNRKDSSGNLRPLHIAQAQATASLVPYACKNTKRQLAPGVTQLAACRYFSVYEYLCDDALALTADGRSFMSFTCVEGEGEASGQPFRKGDTFFAPAGLGKVDVTGRCRLVLTKLTRYYMGIDIGGADTEGSIIDEDGRFMAKGKVPSETAQGAAHVLNNITELIRQLLDAADMSVRDIQGISIGVPGTVDAQRGEVVYANNLRWRNVPVVDILKKEFDTEYRITNDGNAYVELQIPPRFYTK
jgi:mannose-6-phosphate isomerase